jgi:2-iminobutanoate/2-iminopropanoate deaminase
MIKQIVTVNAPAAIGPYSQALVHTSSKLVFCSGCIPLTPLGSSDPITTGDITTQTKQALSNLAAVLAASDSSPSLVLKTTVFLKNMEDFASMNKVYEEFFAGHKPARSTVEVARLPKDALFEIECIASTRS